MGRRLGELTKNNTKCMVQVNGTALIDRLLLQLSRLDLKRVVIVVGYEGKKLREYIGTRYDHLLHIEYVNNPVYDKTNNIYSLALAKDHLQEDDTLLIESDLIFDEEMFSLILDNPCPNLALVACEINSLLPAEEIPAMTGGYEGFYHLLEMNASVERAEMKYIIRDHDAEKFTQRCEAMRDIEKSINEKYGAGTAKLSSSLLCTHMR